MNRGEGYEMNVLSDIECVCVCVCFGYFSILKESDLKGGQRCCGFFLCLIQLCLKESN